MNAKLIDQITYQDGLIQNNEEVRGGINYEISPDQVVEENLRGWGQATAVVKIEGEYFLAEVTD